MRIYLAAVLLFSVVWPAGSFGQELIWQGRIEDGVVDVTKETFSEGVYPEFSDFGFPIKFVEWENGYSNNYFSIKKTGEVVPCSVSKGRHAVSICNPANGKWYLSNNKTTTESPKPGIGWLQSGPFLNQGWQIGQNRYVLITDNQTFLFNSKSGEMKLLDSELRLGWPVGASNGVIAVRGQSERSQEILRVFEQDGRLIYERSEKFSLKEIRYLAIDNAGTFIEFSLGEAKINRDMVYDKRVRVSLVSETELPIQIPLPGGRLNWQGNNFAVWGKGLETLVVRLDDHNIWQPVKELSGMATSFTAFENGGFVLALQELGGGVSLSFYDANGHVVSGPFSLENVVEMTMHDSGVFVVNSFSQTSLFQMNN